MTEKKCPRCGGVNYQISDEYVVAYLYEVQDGVVEADGMQNDAVEHVRTTCACRDCGHHWHPRNFDYTIDQ